MSNKAVITWRANRLDTLGSRKLSSADYDVDVPLLGSVFGQVELCCSCHVGYVTGGLGVGSKPTLCLTSSTALNVGLRCAGLLLEIPLLEGRN